MELRIIIEIEENTYNLIIVPATYNADRPSIRINSDISLLPLAFMRATSAPKPANINSTE
jgi:hypothetical protein